MRKRIELGSKISIKRIVVICIFLFYVSTNSFWGYSLFHDTDFFPALACVFPAILVALPFIQKGTIKTKQSEVLLMVLLFLVIVIAGRFRIKFILFYGLCFSLLLLEDLNDCRDMLRLFYHLAILFAIGSLINLVLPGVYRAIVLPCFSRASTYQKLLYWINNKNITIIPGFANQTSYNACHFVYGIGYLASQLIVRKKLRIREWCSFVLFIACLVLANKRAHLLFTTLSLAFCYYCTAKSREKAKRILIIVLGGTLFLLILYYAIKHVRLGVFRKLNAMLNNLEKDEDITSGRLSLYAVAWKYFLKHPIFGIGWENFRVIPELGQIISTHNIYLELLCETGVVGTAIFLAFFLKALLTAIRNCKRNTEREAGVAAFFLLFMQIFFLLYGLTGNPLYDTPYYFPYFLVCAFSFSQRTSRGKVRFRIKSSPVIRS